MCMLQGVASPRYLYYFFKKERVPEPSSIDLSIDLDSMVSEVLMSILTCWTVEN